MEEILQQFELSELAVHLEHMLRIVIATLLGLLIGIERKNRNKSAGIRTHAIVALGAALFMAEDVYQSIPEKWRTILDECCVEAGIWEQENAANDEADMIEFLKGQGVEWNEVDIDAFTKACDPVYDWIVEEYNADPELHGKLIDLLTKIRSAS